MFTEVFEVCPAPGKKDEYLALAKQLKPNLESTNGFIDNERFESKRREGWVLSLSTWRDEKALVRWRTNGEHHGVQEKGRGGIFSDYHLRVCDVTCDTDPPGVLTTRRNVSTRPTRRQLPVSLVNGTKSHRARCSRYG
jgi:heme-degrading monooxygenase HmoA